MRFTSELIPALTVIGLVSALIWLRVRGSASQRQVLYSATPELPVPQYHGMGGFLRRHYHGDFSLARSYWVNTLLLSLFAPALAITLLPWLGDNFPARYGSAAFLAVLVLSLVIWYWALAGTWRSAGKHTRRGGSAGWAAVAKLMLALSVLRTVGALVAMMPTLSEHLRVAGGSQLGPSTNLEVRADGRSLLLSGGINDGSAEALDQALQRAPGVNTVVLASGGGWIREGQRLAEVIRKRGLNTYVEGFCASACTIAFLAGKERAAAPAAKLGFHASRSVGSTAKAPSAEETAQLRTLYRQAGLPEAFVRRVLDTPHDTMWYPSHEELLAAGFFTRKSVGGETASLSTNVRTKAALSQEFKKVEMYAQLAERSPADFVKLINAAWDAMQRGATDAEITGAARAQLSATLPKFLPMASNDTLVAYQALMQEQLEDLRRRDPKACVEAAFPSGQGMSVVANLSEALTRRELQLLAQMIKEADPKRRLDPSRQDIARVAQRAAKGMTQAQLLVFSDKTWRQKSPATETCEAAIKFFAGLNAIPLAERGSALRVLYSAH